MTTSFSRRITELAEEEPDALQVTCGDHHLSRAQFDRLTNRLARDLAGRGVALGDLVTIALPNSVDWFVALAACWKLGAIPQPVSAALPDPELRAIVELAGSVVVLGIDAARLPGRSCLPIGYQPPADLDDGPLPDATSPSWKAPTSGGSTGRPKLILDGAPATVEALGMLTLFAPAKGCLVMPGPLFHNAPIVWSCVALLQGCHVVVLARFDAEETLASVERYRATVLYVVPTMMKRIWRLPTEVRERFDLSSLVAVWHIAEPCPIWLKQAWIDWLGPERILELYAGTEAQVATLISGVEWLAHRGSVGRPVRGEVTIRDDEGREVPAGTEGEVWMRGTGKTYRYIGAEARTLPGGWESLGDMGRVDEEGYLYLGDRKQDMILVGGENVYPAEVEAAIQEHPAVRSVAVIGLPDEDFGHRIHAVVEADPDEVTTEELLAFVATRVARYKVPRTVEFVDEPLRNDAGKVRRSALVEERS
jgi:bile acid-coenzyme A ligase